MKLTDDDKPITRDWIEKEFTHVTYPGGCGVATFALSLRTNSLGFEVCRWELQVWPEFEGRRAVTMRLSDSSYVPLQWQYDLPSIKSRGELRALVNMLSEEIRERPTLKARMVKA